MNIQFVQLILKEIVAEGLEGITFQSLVNHLQANEYHSKLCSNKEFLWKLITKFEDVNFYKLHTPRESNYKIQHRSDHFNMKDNCFTEEKEPFEQQFSLAFVKDETILGSCQSYYKRVLIDYEVKTQSLSFATIEQKYGNSLVIVANETVRHMFLGVKDVSFAVSKKEYACLELLGRHRYNGIASIGKYSILSFLKDSQSMWYLHKQLRMKDLIRVQEIYITNYAGKNQKVKLFHLKSFYQPYYNVFEQSLQRLYLYSSLIPCSAINTDVFHKVLGFNTAFMNRALKFQWIEKIHTTYRKLNETCHLPLKLSDHELLALYNKECCLSEDGLYTISDLDEFYYFIKPTKSEDVVQQVLIDLESQHEEENVGETVPDISLCKKININDEIDIQILNMLACEPMSEQEIKETFDLNKSLLRKIIREMLTEKQITVSFKSIGKHSVAYYSIRERTHETNDPNLESTTEEIKLEEYHCGRSNKTRAPMDRNPRRRERYQYLIELVKSKIIIPGVYVARRQILDWEKSKDLIGVMDRKSFLKIVEDAVVNNEIEKLEVVFDVPGKRCTETWLVLPGVDRESQVFKEQYELSKLPIINKDKHVNVLPVQSKKKNKKKEKLLQMDLMSNVNVLNSIKNVEYNTQNVIDFKFPELPLMIRRKLLHEFIWYICYGAQLEPNIYQETKVDRNGFRIYSDQDNWKRYVVPLAYDHVDAVRTFDLNDILVRIPLCILCLLINPKECNQELYSHLSDDSLKWQTIGNILSQNTSVIAYLFTNGRRICLRKLIDLLESIMNMGLMTRRDVTVKYRYQGVYYLNKHVFLTDTSKQQLPMADEHAWMKLPRFQWILNTKVDVLNYWENVFNVCTNTKSKTIYKAYSLLITSPEFYENKRNIDFIKTHIKDNGPLLPAYVEHIGQFGAWLPLDSLTCLDLGAGGFCSSILSSNILNWCQNRFDKSCKQLPNCVTSGFVPFRSTLFTEVERDLTTARHISSLNEELSCILNEINIILIAVTVLHYDNNMEFFWGKIRKTNWFKASFSHIGSMNLNTVNKYITILTPDHDNEREYLIDHLRSNHLVITYLNKKETMLMTHDNWIREVAVIRMLLNQLIKIHSFIPQWNSRPSNGQSIEYLINQITSSNVKLRTKVDDTKLMTGTTADVNKRMVLNDSIDTIDDIISLTLAKYLTGCMQPYVEHKPTDISTRNTILRKYTLPVMVAAINSFKNFYVMEPLKAKHVKTHSLILGHIDTRLRKLSPRFVVQTTYQAHNDMFITKYLTWSEPPPLVNNVMVHRVRLDKTDMIDVILALTSLFVMSTVGDGTGGLDVNVAKHNLVFHGYYHNQKAPSHSKIYGVNLKRKLISEIDWRNMIADLSLTITMDKALYHSLFDPTYRTDVWQELGGIITLTKTESEEPTRKKRKHDKELERLVTCIEEREFGGRNHAELKNYFPDVGKLNDNLKRLIKSGEIYVVGVNDYHFVSRRFIRPWLIKLPCSSDQNRSKLRSRKRSRSVPDTDNSTYFVPEFYRGESAQFKCATFKEIIDKLYVTAYKSPGMTLADLMTDLSVFLGPNVVRQLVNVLVKYNVIELRQLHASGRCGLFQQRVAYSIVATDPYDNGHNTTVIVQPHSHTNMLQLINDMGQYFGVDMKDTSGEHVTMEER